MADLTVSTKFTAVDKFSKKVNKMSAVSQKFASKTQAGMSRVQRASRRLATQTGNLTSKIFNLRNAAVALGAGYAIKKTYDFASSMAKSADEAAKMGRQLGISAQGLSEIRFAAERSGVSATMVDKAFESLNKRVGELGFESGSLFNKLDKMGKQGLIEQLKRAKNTEEAFNLMTGAIANAETTIEANTLASAAFSKANQKMVRLMANGTDGVEQLRSEFRKLHGDDMNQLAKQSEAFMDAQADMQTAMKGTRVTIGTTLIPQVTELQQKITEWVSNNRELIKTKVDGFIDKVSNAIKFLHDNSSLILGALKAFIGAMVVLKAVNISARVSTLAMSAALGAYQIAIGIAGAATGKASIAIGASRTAMIAYKVATAVATGVQWAFAAAVNAGLWPILAIIAVIAGLVIGIRALIKHWDKVKAAMTGVWEVIKNVGNIIKTALVAPIKFLVTLITGLGKILWFVFTGRFKKAVQAGKETFGSLKDQVVSDAKEIKKQAVTMGKDFNKGFDRSMEKSRMKAAQKQAAGMTPEEAAGGTQPTQTPALNREALTQQIQLNREERTRNDRLTIGINDDTGRARIDEDTGGFVPQTEGTLGF